MKKKRKTQKKGKSCKWELSNCKYKGGGRNETCFFCCCCEIIKDITFKLK